MERRLRVGANLPPELSAAQDLEGLERRLSTDEEALAATRERRDVALAAELARERAEPYEEGSGDGS